MTYTIRSVGSPQELAGVFDVLGAQLPSRLTHRNRTFADLDRRFPVDRQLMLLADRDDGHVAGGALAFRTTEQLLGSGSATVRLIAVVAEERGKGLGRLLMERLEAEAVGLGVGRIFLGAGPDVRGFYRRLGYSGRSRMAKALPGSVLARYGAADQRRRALEELRARREGRQTTASKQPSRE